jgi:hypothetical protein
MRVSTATITLIDTPPYTVVGNDGIQLIVSRRQNSTLTSIASYASRSRTHPSVLLRDVGSTSYIIYKEVGWVLANHSVSPFLGASRLAINDVWLEEHSPISYNAKASRDFLLAANGKLGRDLF